MATSPSDINFEPYAIAQLDVLLVQDYESIALVSTEFAHHVDRRHWDDFDSTVSDSAVIP